MKGKKRTKASIAKMLATRRANKEAKTSVDSTTQDRIKLAIVYLKQATFNMSKQPAGLTNSDLLVLLALKALTEK